jgi:hypothetical protein
MSFSSASFYYPWQNSALFEFGLIYQRVHHSSMYASRYKCPISHLSSSRFPFFLFIIIFDTALLYSTPFARSKMAPSMCQWVMDLPMPWVWFRNKVRAVNCLHFHSNPIPGIYLSHPEGWFLVAMKPNSVWRDSNFFKMQVALGEDEAAVYMENGLTVCPSCEFLLHTRSIWNNFVAFGQIWSSDSTPFIHSQTWASARSLL